MASLAQEVPAVAGQTLSVQQPNAVGSTVTPEQLDVGGFTATAGPFRRGLRAGANSVGTMLNSLAGQVGQELGLTEFAADRFKVAEEFAAMSDAVGPEVRDVAHVKDMDSLVEFVAGHAGSGIATSVPALGLAIGLRRPVTGVFAGSAPLEAGEQVRTLRKDPNVAPDAVLPNALLKGAAGGALEVAGGAPAQVARRILSPGKAVGGIASATAKATAGEAVTEGAQDLVGQALHREVNPEKQIDWHDVINSAAAGAAGGMAIGGAGSAAAALPGAVAKTAEELKSRLGPRQKPLPDDSDVLNSLGPDSSVEDIDAALKSGDDRADVVRSKVWEAIKDRPEAQRLKDWKTDLDQEAALDEEIRGAYHKKETAPMVKRAIDAGRSALNKGIEAIRGKPVEKFSKRDQPIDSRSVVASLLHSFGDNKANAAEYALIKAKSAGSEEMKEKYLHAAKVIKGEVEQFNPGRGAMRYMKRDEEEDRTPLDMEIHDYMVERLPDNVKAGAGDENLLGLSKMIIGMAKEPGATQASGLAGATRRAIGPKFQEIMDFAIDKVHSTPESKTFAKEAVFPAFRQAEATDELRLKKIKNLLLTYSKDKYVNDPKQRKVLMDTVAPRALAALDNPSLTDDEFVADVREVAGERAEVLLDLLEGVRSEEAELAKDDGEEKSAIERVQDYHPDIGRPVYISGTAEQMKTKMAALEKKADRIQKDIGPKNASIRIDYTESSNTWSIEMGPPEDVGYNNAEWERIKESKKYNRSKLEEGIVTVRTIHRPQGEKINLVNMTREMVRREGQDTRDDPVQYAADMFSRGLSNLLSDPRFQSFRTELETDEDGNMVFPDETLVARIKGVEYRFKDIKTAKLTRKALANITDEDIKREMDEGLEYDKAVKVAVQKARDAEMAKTMLDSLEDMERGEMSDEDPLARELPSELEERRTESDVRVGVGAIQSPSAANKEPAARKKLPKPKGKPGAVLDHPGQPKQAIEQESRESLEKNRLEVEERMRRGEKLSAKNVDLTKELSEEEKQEIRDYIESVLGKDKTKVLFEKMKDAGGFIEDKDGVETFRFALNAADPMSVGYHEGMHGLFNRLLKTDKKAAQTLLRAASSPTIVARLNELLKGNKAALAQLSDPEERLAYAYQLWAKGKKGLFGVGPETEGWFNKVKSFLRKVSAIWSDEMTDALAVERAGEIINAFHNGDFADRNTVAEVMRDKFPLDPRERMDKVWPMVGKLADKFLFTATGAVRDTNVPEFMRIMDEFHIGQGTRGKAPGFLQTKHVVANRFMNRVLDVVGKMSAVKQRELLDEMRSGKPRTSPAAKEMETILNDLHAYLVRSGVKTFVKNPDGSIKYTKKDGVPEYRELQKLDNYFPRVPDAEYVTENRDAFLALMRKYKVKDPNAVYRLWTQDPNLSAAVNEDVALGLTYFTPQTNERTLAHIPENELAPFLNKDLFGVMSQYVARAARRGEYTTRFGNVGEGIREARTKAILDQGATPAQAATFDEAVQAMEGTLGADMSEDLKALFGGLMTYQNVRLLPLALLSSVVDPMGIAVRGGSITDGLRAFVRGVRELVKDKNDRATEMAELAGSISKATDAAMLSDMYGSQYLPRVQRAINDKFFKYNGMESWNRSMRIAATEGAIAFIKKHAKLKNETSTRYLEELNLTRDDVVVKNGKLDMENEKVRNAVNLWVDQAILRPNAALRPIYMSDPHWMLVSHLKQYMYLFQKTILTRVHNELQHGNYSPAYALAGYVPMIIASDMLRVMLTPGGWDDDQKEGWDMTDWLWRGVQRAGLFGPGQMVLDSATDMSYSKFGVESAAGPMVQQLMDFARTAATGGDIGEQIVRAIPGERLVR